jgi:hypothetical protein
MRLMAHPPNTCASSEWQLKFAGVFLGLSLLFGTVQARSLPTPIPAGTKWYWQLSGSVFAGHGAARIYDIDLEDSSVALISKLRDAGHTVICYFSAGSYEPWRSDASQFPDPAIGRKLPGWPEYYVDIRDPGVRRIMQARIDRATSKGCNGFEPDVLDAFSNDSGFPITDRDEIDYIRFLGNEGHKRGLLVALKNDPALVSDAVDLMDFAIVEECFEHDECSAYSPFVRQNKAVLAAEYAPFSTSKCARAKQLGFSLVFYDLNLDGRRYRPCP